MKTFRIDFRRDIVTELPSFQFTRASASVSDDGNYYEQAKLDFETDAGQYKLGPGIMRLQFDLFSYNYFSFNIFKPDTRFTVPGYAHIFAIARYDNSSLFFEKKLFGQGIVLGNVSDFRNPVNNSIGNPIFPSTQSKTWAGKTKDKTINRTSWSEKLKDGVQYRVVLDSIVTNKNTSKVRYQLYEVLGVDTLEKLFDTGQIDAGVFDFDPVNSGVCIGHVYGNKNADVWKLEFTNVKTIWGPYLTEDAIPDDPCTCPRDVTVYSNKGELFDIDIDQFKLGFDYGEIEKTPNGTSIKGFRDYAVKTTKGYRIQVPDTQYARPLAILDLGLKFKTPEDVLQRNLRPNIIEPKGYDSWTVEVKGTATILHDIIEFEEGSVIPFNKIITDQFLNFGNTFPAKNLSASTPVLDTAIFTKFKLKHTELQKQRTIRKNIFLVFKFSEIFYNLNLGTSGQQRFLVGSNVEVTVSIPIDLGQADCCGNDIKNLPDPPLTEIIPTVKEDSIILTLNKEVGSLIPVTYVGGNGLVSVSISPELPLGLKFDKKIGEITGTPLTTFPPTRFTVTFKDNKNETATANFSIKVDSGA
jgi:hypothetical protein